MFDELFVFDDTHTNAAVFSKRDYWPKKNLSCFAAVFGFDSKKGAHSFLMDHSVYLIVVAKLMLVRARATAPPSLPLLLRLARASARSQASQRLLLVVFLKIVFLILVFNNQISHPVVYIVVGFVCFCTQA